jgi:hypothetical protein
MSDFPRHWLPKSTRNRWALALAICSLLLLITWNLMPNYEHTYATDPPSLEKNGINATMIWPAIFEAVIQNFQGDLAFDDVLSMIATFSLLLLVMVNILVIPFWDVAAKSKVLRFIPACICSLGFAALVYFLIEVFTSVSSDWLERYEFSMICLIGLNFLLMALSLLLFGQEPAQGVELDVPIP